MLVSAVTAFFQPLLPGWLLERILLVTEEGRSSGRLEVELTRLCCVAPVLVGCLQSGCEISHLFAPARACQVILEFEHQDWRSISPLSDDSLTFNSQIFILQQSEPVSVLFGRARVFRRIPPPVTAFEGAALCCLMSAAAGFAGATNRSIYRHHLRYAHVGRVPAPLPVATAAPPEPGLRSCVTTPCTILLRYHLDGFLPTDTRHGIGLLLGARRTQSAP